MILFNFKITGGQLDALREYSAATGLTMAEYLRRMIDQQQPLRDKVLSGAAVTGMTAHTTSGDVWLGRAG